MAIRRDLLGKLFFLALSLPSVLRAAARVHRSLSRHGLDDAAATLVDVPPFACSALGRPRLLAGAVDRLLPLLPPPRVGRCLKRSLLLLDLWSRCGVQPRLHVGYARNGGEPSFHAWVTSSQRPDLDVSGGVGHAEIWSSAPDPAS